MWGRHSAVVLVVGGLAASCLALSAALADEQADAARVPALISQLGSRQYGERVAAMRELNALGAAALPLLRQAAEHPDAEIRRRADDLVVAIEKRLETARLLEPTRVRLVYKNKPIAEAVQDFAKKTGYPLQCGAAPAKRGEAPKAIPGNISLDTGEVPFWEAFDLLCRQAGLADQSLLPPKPQQTARDVDKDLRKELEVAVALQRQALMLHEARTLQTNQPCVLVPGKMPEMPTCQTGAVRVRALPLELPHFAATRTPEAIQLHLEVLPEQKLSAFHLVNIVIDKAIDEAGQALTPLPSPGRSDQDDGDVINILLNGQDLPVGDASRRFPIRLQPGKNPSQRLAELTGTAVAQVQTPPETLLTVENVLKAVGKSVKGAGGHTLQVLEAAQKPDGDIDLRVEVNNPNVGAGGGRINVIRGARIVRVGGGGMVVDSSEASGPMSPTLFDAKGYKFPLRRMETRQVVKGNEWVQEFHLTYQADRGRVDSARLIFTGRRTTVLEVPFTLRDVPLPPEK